MIDKRRVYVICPDRNNPLGGVKQLYRLVDILRSAGHDAYILHKKKNFRVTWYENNTPIIHFPGLFKRLTRHRKQRMMRFLETIIYSTQVPEKGSLLIFPEIYGQYINLFKEYQTVIFNQNCYYTFDLAPLFEPFDSPYNSPNLLGAIVVSEDSKQYMQQFFPQVNVNRIRIGLSDNFVYSAGKKKQIAFMPRKLAEDANQIYQYFSRKDYFADWKFIAIDKLNEQQVAEVLRESAIFLSFNYREGFGLPPVEAMACGCYVVGYTGNAGREYLKPEFSMPIPDRDISKFVLELEKAIETYNRAPGEIIQKGLAASKYVLSIYNKNNEKEDVIAAWNSIIKKS